jgi:hypothetical protein
VTRVALGASGLVLAFAALGCSSGPKNDHDAIKQLWQEFFKALDSGNVGAAVKLYPSDCDDSLERQLTSVFGALESRRDDVDYHVTDVQIENLTGTSADAAPVGTITFRGEDEPMESDGYAQLVKEGGSWKFAGCDVIGSSPFASPTPQEAPR